MISTMSMIAGTVLSIVILIAHVCINTLRTGVQYIRTSISAYKTAAVFGCLTSALAPPPIALESGSRAQTDWPV